jgi:hypothetical protein
MVRGEALLEEAAFERGPSQELLLRGVSTVMLRSPPQHKVRLGPVPPRNVDQAQISPGRTISGVQIYGPFQQGDREIEPVGARLHQPKDVRRREVSGVRSNQCLCQRSRSGQVFGQ